MNWLISLGRDDKDIQEARDRWTKEGHGVATNKAKKGIRQIIHAEEKIKVTEQYGTEAFCNNIEEEEKEDPQQQRFNSQLQKLKECLAEIEPDKLTEDQALQFFKPLWDQMGEIKESFKIVFNSRSDPFKALRITSDDNNNNNNIDRIAIKHTIKLTPQEKQREEELIEQCLNGSLEQFKEITGQKIADDMTLKYFRQPDKRWQLEMAIRPMVLKNRSASDNNNNNNNRVALMDKLQREREEEQEQRQYETQ